MMRRGQRAPQIDAVQIDTAGGLTWSASRAGRALGRMVKSKPVVALLTVAILTVPTLSTLDLKQSGERGAEAQRHVELYVTDLESQDGIDRLISGATNSSEARRQLTEKRDQGEEHLREAVEMGLPPIVAVQVTTLTHDYTHAVDRKLQLLASGLKGDASALDAALVNPAFKRVNTFLERERTQLETQAADDQKKGNLGMLLTVLLALILGSLVQSVRKRGDVSRRAKAQSEARYRALIDQSADLVAVVDRAGLATLVSPSVERLLVLADPAPFGAAADSAGVGPVDFISVLDPMDRQRFSTALQTAATPGTLSAGEFRLNGRDGTGTYEVFVQDLSADPSVGGLVLTAHDVTDRLALQHEMEHRALHDTLTGLPNRALLADRFEQALRAAERSGTSAGLLLLDLDRFKEVNDTFGHHYGDELLRQIAPRLTAVLRSVDTLARLGGDEFAVLLQNVHEVEDATEVANALLVALSAPFHVEGVDLDVEASVGVVISGEHGEDPVTLMQHADIAMYIAKRQHLGVFAYDPSVDGHSATKLAMIGDLRRGLRRGELVLHYQPKVNIATGDLVGVEGLVRWQHPEHGLVSPDAFIPLAERTGLINPLTRHILDTALAQARIWIDAGRPLPIAVNLSARNLHNERFAAQVDELLAVHDVPAHLLELEVTETAIMIDPVRACQMLEKLSALGIRLSLDDFGAGYTSLSQLKALPISEIKIDRSFVKMMNEDRRDRVIVQSIIALGHNLGLVLVAEGVETQGALATLASFGCDVIQGYYMTRPIPIAAFDSWSAGRQITPLPARGVPLLDTAYVDDSPARPTPATSSPAPPRVPLTDVLTGRDRSFSGAVAPEQNRRSDHVVFLFDDREQLLHEVTMFMSDGLSYGGHVLMIVSAEHGQVLRAALPQIRLERAESEGRFLALDAEQTLSQFMVDGLPDRALFEQSVGSTLRSHLIETAVLSAYCELGDVLCQAGNLIGALKVEELWNELQLSTTFSLFCAQPLADVEAQAGDPLAQICDRHSHVLLPDPWTRTQNPR
jgi:diguanylate cyclase (GGDEF)-like protein/PAS domain S-box-containing protein